MPCRIMNGVLMLSTWKIGDWSSYSFVRVPRRDVGAHAHLADRRDALLQRAGALVELIVEADEVRRRRARDDRGEHVGLRHDEARLISAPAVAVQADVLRIGVARAR